MICFSCKSVKSILSTSIYRTKFSKKQQRTFKWCVTLNEKINDSNSSQSTTSKETKDYTHFPVTSKKNLPYVVPEKDQELVNELKKGNIIYPYKDPIDRANQILKEDLKVNFRKIFKIMTNVQLGSLELKYFPRHTDILIIGGGPIGLAIAYALRSKFPYGPDVIVIDPDIKFSHLTTNLAQATLLQQQFTADEEFLMSQYCAEFLSTIHRHTQIDGHPPFRVSYEPMGSLVLADEQNAENLLKMVEKQKFHNGRSKVLEPDDIKKEFPWLNLENVSLGALGCVNEGVFDPWSFLTALKCKATNMGVMFIEAEAIDFGMDNGVPRRVICKLPDGTYNSIDFAHCVVAAGIQSIRFLEILNAIDYSFSLTLPIEEKKRYEYCFYSPDGPGLNTPIVIDPKGYCFRREGLLGHYVASAPPLPSKEDEENTLLNVFAEEVYPFLKKRIPDFDKVEVMKGWIDYYDYNTANQIGVLDRHPIYQNMVFATGFTHRGIQYAPAVGRAVMEIIFYGDYQTIDFAPFHFENMYLKQKLEAEQRRKEYLNMDSERQYLKN